MGKKQRARSSAGSSPPPAAATGDAGAAAPTGARLWLFRAVSAALPLLLFALVEGGLHLGGVGHDPSFAVRCRVQGRPSWCENPAFTAPFFPEGQGRSATSFAFPAQKGPRTFRVFILGESAAQGDPEPSFGFGRYLQAMLEERLPGLDVEVINTGVPAINSHVILPIAREVAGLGADLFLVYAGNNEVVGPFGAGTVLTQKLPSAGLVRAAVALRRTRLWQLVSRALRPSGAAVQPWRGMEMFLEQQVRADAPELEGVYRSFRRNLEDAVAAARGAGAKVVLSTVATRLEGCAPFSSLHRPGLTADEEGRWTAAVARGGAHEREGDSAAALADYREALALDDRYAELHYRLAGAASKLGSWDDAAAALIRARDLDTLRFRADSRINQITREVAASAGAGVSLVDGEAALARASPHGTPGAALFYEHAHLTPEGNYLLAASLFPAVLAAVPPALRPAGSAAEPPSAKACAARLALSGFDRRRVASEVLDRLSRPPFTGQLDHAAQVAELRALEAQAAAEPLEAGEALYRAALLRAPADPWLHFDFGLLLDAREAQGPRTPGARSAAVEQYRAALALLPQQTLAAIKLAEGLARHGQADEALAVAATLLEQRPGYPAALLLTGRLRLQKGEHAEAAKAFERLLVADPAVYEARLGLAMSLAEQGAVARAAAEFERAAALRADDPAPRWSLVVVYLSLDRRDDAIRLARETARSLRAAGHAADAERFEQKLVAIGAQP